MDRYAVAQNALRYVTKDMTASLSKPHRPLIVIVGRSANAKP